MRRLLAVGLPVVLQVGALCAPLVHVHLDGHHDDHHAAAAIHAHVDGHGRGHHASAPLRHDAPALAAGEEPEWATRFQIFVAVAAAACATPAPPPARFTLAPVPGSVMRRPPEVVRSHGPPLSRAATPRAPPSVSV